MGISDDAVKAARAIAAVPTKARMTADVARASRSVQNLTRHFRDNLFERKLTVNSARRAIRSRDHSISTRFRNVADFSGSPVPAQTPEELLASLTAE